MPDYFVFNLNGQFSVYFYRFARFYLMKIKRTFLFFYLWAFYMAVM